MISPTNNWGKDEPTSFLRGYCNMFIIRYDREYKMLLRYKQKNRQY